MRFDKFTVKSQELVQNAQSLASGLNHQQIEPEHLLAAMLSEREGIARGMLQKLGVSPDIIEQEVKRTLESMPQVSGAGDVYLSSRSKSVLDGAFSEASKMKDEYVSIEHILLAIIEEKGGKAKDMLRRSGITRDALLKALLEIRGSQRITDPNPEEKYQALERFSRDLTDLAKPASWIR